jgi:FkbM family methyltransferase
MKKPVRKSKLGPVPNAGFWIAGGALTWNLVIAAGCEAPSTPSAKPQEKAAHVPANPSPAPPAVKDDAPPMDPAHPFAPLFLKDSEESAKFLGEFPLDQYRVFSVGEDRFFLDHLPDFIKNHIRHGVEWEPQLTPHIKAFARPGTTAIDAGAHIGTHTIALARAVGTEGKVFAFEPQRKLHRELHHNLRLNGLTQAKALRFALGDESGVIEMSPPVKGNEGGTGVGSGGDKAELRPLDDFPFKNVSFLKVDVEGFEIPVIRGATKLIKRERPVILVEILGGVDLDNATAEQKGKIKETQDLIQALGYIVKRVDYYDYLALPKERFLAKPIQPGTPATEVGYEPNGKGPTRP